MYKLTLIKHYVRLMQFKMEKIISFITHPIGSITEPTHFQINYSHLSKALFKQTEQFPQMDIVLFCMPKLFSKEILADYIICFIFCLNLSPDIGKSTMNTRDKYKNWMMNKRGN